MRELVGNAAASRHIDNILIPLFTNVAFLPFLKNLLCSMRRLQVKNWMVMAMDNATCPGLAHSDFLDAEAHGCVQPYVHDKSIERTERMKYGSGGFWKMVVQRPLWIRWLLTQGYTVIQCDVDIVWIKNPIPYLTSHTVAAPPRRCGSPKSMEGIHEAVVAGDSRATRRYRASRSRDVCPHHNSTLLVQSEAMYGYNCGFYFIRPSNSSIWFMDEWMQEMLHPTREGKMHEQHAMIATVGNVGSKTQLKWIARGMQFVRLDEPLFPTGKLWYDKWQSSGSNKIRSYILHCNWITQATQKKLRLRRENLWFLDNRDDRCQPGFDPLIEDCLRRCVPVMNCSVGTGVPCSNFGCHGFTQRALTDLARSLRLGPETPEDRWHPIAWKKVCPIANASLPPDGAQLGGTRYRTTQAQKEALNRAAAMLRDGARATAIFALHNLTDIKGKDFKRSLSLKAAIDKLNALAPRNVDFTAPAPMTLTSTALRDIAL